MSSWKSTEKISQCQIELLIDYSLDATELKLAALIVFYNGEELKKKDHAREEREKLIKIKEMQKIFQDKCRAKNRKKKMEMRKRRYEKKKSSAKEKLKALIEQREMGFAENGTASYLQGTIYY